MSVEAVPARGGKVRTSLLDRLLAVTPLASIYLWLALVYGFEAVKHRTPSIFSDELKWTQFARAISHHGVASIRGDRVGFQTLYVYLMAPAWWLHSTSAAYSVVKYLNVFAMTAAVVPAYLLARRLVSKPSALLVAAASGAIPSMAYALEIIPEVVAYPWAVLCAWLIVEALATRSRRWIAPAVAASIVAPAVRGQFVVIPAAFAGAAFALWWRGASGLRFRARWTRADTFGLALLAFGAFVVVNRWIGNGNGPWHTTTDSYKSLVLKQAVWSLGALAIGLGVLPLLGGLVSLVPRRGERLTPYDRAFIATTSFFLLTFALYTGVKGAYLQLTFATRVTERNMIYVSPLLFLGTAITFERRRIRVGVLGAATALVAYVLVATPLQLDWPYFEALGFSIASMSNRYLYWSAGTIETVTYVVLAISVALLALRWVLRVPAHGRRRIAAVAAGALLGAVVIGWNLTGQISSAIGSDDFSTRLMSNLPQPPDWIDQATNGGTVTYLGQQLGNNLIGVNMLEFWNRSIVKVWSTDGSAPPPGGTLTPNLARIDGTLSNPPGTDYLLADSGVDVAGTPVARRGALRLYPLDGPIRLRDSVEHVAPDGWMSTDAAYNQFATAGDRRSVAIISLSRVGYCGDAPPGRATIDVGRIVIGPDKEAGLGRRWARRSVSVPNCKDTLVRVPVGRPPWRVQVRLAGTFSTPSDARKLGAVFSVRAQPR
jgi:hypothetical protein